MKNTFFLVAMFCAGQSLASTTVMIDGANWGFKFDPTSAQTRKNGSAAAEFQFEVVTRDGFIITGFVEPAEGKGTNAETCRSFYWQLSSKNPAIVKDSILVASKGGPFEVVSYVVNGSEQGQRLVQVNANYYGFRDGKCIDIHVSQAFPESAEPDYSNLLSFAKSFRYTDGK